MNIAPNKEPIQLEKPKPAINEPPSAAAQQVQQTPHQISKELTDIEKGLEILKEHKKPWNEDNLRILENLFEKFFQYLDQGNVVTRIGDLLVKHNFFDVVVKIWDHCHSTENMEESYLKSPSYHAMKSICRNFSDKSVNFCKEAFRHKMVFERFMREFILPELSAKELDNDGKRQRIEVTLGFLYNTLRYYNPNRELVRQNDGIERMLSYYDSDHLIIKALVMIVLAYCVNEEQNDKIITGKGVIKFLMEILKGALEQPDHKSSTSSSNFSASEIVCGFNKLALNDNNKVSIVDKGVLPHLMKMLTGNKFPDEHTLAAKCLWSLSFHPNNKERIAKEPELMDAVHRLLIDSKSDQHTRKCCEGILFILEGKDFSDLTLSASVVSDAMKQHVMISYQWDVQPIILKVRDILLNNGFNVWLDVDNMQGSILSAMADAVENASVVVICVTEKYKNSNACRTEAEYAYKLSKPIAPLLLEPHYKADGWLGALLGMQLYVDVSSEDVLNAKVDEIIKMVKSKVVEQIVESEIVATDAPRLAAPSNTMVDGPSSSQSVTKFSTNNLSKLTEEIEDVNKSSSYLTALSDTVVDGPTSSKSVNKWSTEDVSKWAEETGIDGLPSLLATFDGLALEQLVLLEKENPQDCYDYLQSDLKFSRLQSLKFTQVLKKL